MKLFSFFIFALVCSIQASQEDIDISELIDIRKLNTIDFESFGEKIDFNVTIDLNDPNIVHSTEIYEKVTIEIEGINEDSEESHDRLNELREESSNSKWSSALAGALNGVFGTIFSTAANVIDSSVNVAVEKFNVGISSTLKLIDRVHTQKKLFIVKAKKCAEQTGKELDSEVFAKLESCIPEAVNQVNATAQRIINNIRKVRNFMTEMPGAVENCVNIMRRATFMTSLTSSAKAIYCLGGVTTQVGTDAAKLGATMTACGVRCALSFVEIKLGLEKCYMEGLACVGKEAADKGISLGQCVIKTEENNSKETQTEKKNSNEQETEENNSKEEKNE